MSDYIVLDTETTGLNSKTDRVIEIGAVRIRGRQITSDYFHHYLRPDCPVHPAAQAVHGITDSFLQDKPGFDSIAQGFIDWVQGATLVIHNAPFDTGFMNMELARLGLPDLSHYTLGVIDTLALARSRYRGKKNDLNTLLTRYGIDSSERTLHGALLDAKLLALLYIKMTQQQEEIEYDMHMIQQSDQVHESLGSFDHESNALKVEWIDQ